MEKNVSKLEIQLPTTMDDLCPDNDIFMEASEEGDLKEKAKKKKKKGKGGLQSPKRILAFNTSELLKLDEHKAEMKKSVCEKDRPKCAPFPASQSSDQNQHSESSGDSEDSDRQPPYALSADKHPTLRKSALRGGYEELGLGPRPKLHVKWAPNVWEPPISSISHTINRNRSKKKDSKYNRHCAKSCSDPRKQGKKKSHKLKHNKVSSVHSPSIHGNGEDLSKKLEAESSLQPLPHTNGLPVVLSETAYDEKLEYEPQGEVEVDGKTTAGGGTMNGSLFVLDSKCAASFLGISSMTCNSVCEHAM